MKIRINGDSLRLRVSRSEVERLIRGHRVAETVHFDAHEKAKLTYSLERANQSSPVSIRYEPQHVTVSLSDVQAVQWGQEREVGVYSTLILNPSISLEVMIEKDFACLDRNAKENEDTFENPRAGGTC
jgi:hypothetical protein